jgi:hypothetical protein
MIAAMRVASRVWRGTHTFIRFAPGVVWRSAQLRGRNGLPHRAAE